MSKALDLILPRTGTDNDAAATARNMSVITASKTLTAADQGFVIIDATAGNIALTLPAATTRARFELRRVDTSANTVTVSRAGTDTIEAAATSVSLVGAFASRTLISDGVSKWRSPVVYDNGNFNPTARGTGTAGTFTYTAQGGKFTRIGDRVFFDINIGWSASTATGSLRIKLDGIPHAVLAASKTPVAIRNSGLTVAAGETLQGYVTATNSEIVLEHVAPADGTVTDIAADSVVGQLMISGSYITST